MINLTEIKTARHLMRTLWFLALFCCMQAHATIAIVAAENFYGNVAKDIGGDYVTVTNILSSPVQDPHLFSSTLTQAKQVADADVIVYNGAGYDDWMANLIKVGGKKDRDILIISDVMQTKPGANPHLWYDPKTMPAYAQQLTDLLMSKDPEHRSDYEAHLKKFLSEDQALFEQLDQIKQSYAGTAIIATEPIFNYLAESAGLVMLSTDFAFSVMNEASPTPQQILQFEQNLTNHKAKVLIYNQQVTSPLIEHMKSIAQSANIPMFGVTELQPQGVNYVAWMLEELRQLREALSAKSDH